MTAGLVVSLMTVLFGSSAFVKIGAPERADIALLLPATTMFVAIARMAKHRFSTREDIDGDALGVGTKRARILQSLLQNTLEQLALAVPVYIVALSSQHSAIQAAVPACACLFFLGRLLFFATYERGASARSLGFALTFYPTALLLIWQLGRRLIPIAD